MKTMTINTELKISEITAFLLTAKSDSIIAVSNEISALLPSDYEFCFAETSCSDLRSEFDEYTGLFLRIYTENHDLAVTSVLCIDQTEDNDLTAPNSEGFLTYLEEREDNDIYAETYSRTLTLGDFITKALNLI